MVKLTTNKHESRYRRPILEQRILIYITLAYSGLGLRGLTLAHAGLWALVG